MTLDERLAEIYADALVTAIKRYKSFFKKIQAVDSGKIKPPKYYVDRGLVAKWRQGFVRELLRQTGIIEGIMAELNKAGLAASQAIRDAMTDVYSAVRSEAVARLSEGARMGGKAIKFSELTRQEMETMIQEEQSPFSKIAYQNLGQNTVIRKRLQASMAQAILLGESQQNMVKRIRRITGQAQYQAQRVAQTENTRIQSQATMQASQEAEKQGVRVYHEWSTRMVRSRDTHIALNGKKALAGEVFPGSVLRYPGDPNAPAREVINCHCRLIEHVLLPDEDIEDGRVVKKAHETLNNQGKSGIIEGQRKALTKINVADIPPMDEAAFSKIKEALTRQGVKVIQDADSDDFLEYMNAEALTLSDGSGVLFQSGRTPSASAVFEELIHVSQIKHNGPVGSDDVFEYLNREIEANEKVLRNRKAYHLTNLDVKSIENNLAYYYEQLKEANGSV